MSKRAGIVAAAAVAVALTGTAATWHVDGSSTVTPATGSAEAPFTTIEAAVQAAAAGDTILVGPGEYGADDAGYDAANDVKAVACLTKRLRLESTEGRDRTFLVGRYHDGSSKAGPNAVACVWAVPDGCVVKGFTLKGGASRSNNGGANISANHGGGFSCLNQNRKSYVVDCIVRDCVATRGGGMAFGMAIRTLFVNNMTTGGHGRAARYCDLYSCIVIANSNAEQSSYGKGVGSNAAASDGATRVVNCTFVGNPAGGLEGGSAIAIKIENTVATFSPGAKFRESLYVNEGLTTTARNCVFDGVAFSEEATAKWAFENVVTNASPYQTISPFEGDFRVERGGACDGTGALDADWSAVPEEFRGKDYYGKDLVVDGKCNIGAVADTAERKGGILYTYGWNAVTPFIGETSYRNTWLYNVANAAYVGSATWPRQVYVKAGRNSGSRTPVRFHLSGLGVIADGNVPPRYPDYDGGVWLTMPPVGRVFTNYVSYSSSIRYVDDATGVDDAAEGRGLSAALPHKTIQAAINAIGSTENNPLILVAPGDYKDGVTTNEGFATRVVVDKTVLIRAADRTARDRTIIRGYRDPAKPDAFEDVHVRPLRLKVTYCCVQGFTITEGCTIANNSGNNGCGGLVNGMGVKSVVQDCTFSYGRGSRAGAAQSVWAIRCVFTNNTCGGQCTLRGGAASSCIFTENSNVSAWEVGVGALVYNCSQYSSKMLGANRHVAGEAAYIYNSIFTGGAFGDPLWDGVTYERQGCWSNVNAMDGVAKTETLFVAPGDFRLRADSEAVAKGGSTDSALYGPEYFSLYTTDDVNGNPIVFTAEGKPMPGAVQTVASVVQVTQAAAGEAAIASSVTLDADGKAVVEKGDTITLTAQGSEKRHFLGFRVNGELVAQEEKTFVWTAEDNVLTPTVLSVAYNTDWYVNPDAAAFRDENDGWSPETARTTLAKGVEDAVPGDVVHLAEGTYASGSALVDTQKTPNRVIVPEGVTLAGEGDCAKVIISGVGGAAKTFGADCVRCVWLSSASTLRNVTVTGGSVYGGNASTDVDDYAGGVCAPEKAATMPRVEGCVLTGNHGGRAGALAWVNAVRCRIVGNSARSTGSCGRNANFYGCFIDDNAGNEMLLDGTAIVDCTFGPGNGQPPKHTQLAWNKNALMANCVILTPNKADGTGVICMNISNCVIAAGTALSASLTQDGVVSTFAADDLKVGADGRPAKDSPLVDYGRLAVAQDAGTTGETDLDGIPRVLGARHDLGCCEYDWRPDFARDIGTGFAVTAASAGIVETAGGVAVPGGTITLVREEGARAKSPMRGRVDVTGTGTLVATVNGVEAARWAAGTHALRLYGQGGGDVLALTYVPGEGEDGGDATAAGGATLSSFVGGAVGTILIVR